VNGITNSLVTVPRPERFVEQSILPKEYDPRDGMIRFRTGPIEGRPEYALKKNGSVVRTAPRILNKKERKRDAKAQAAWPKGEGYRFLCGCKALTFHYPSHVKVRIPGYEKMQEVETYKCAVCYEHFDKERIDAAVAAHAERHKQVTNPNLGEPL